MFLFRKKEEPIKVSFFDNLSYDGVLIDIGKKHQRQIDLIRLSEEDLAILKKVEPIVRENIQLVVDTFYGRLMKEKELTDIINHHSSVDKLKKTLNPHVLQMFSGVVDEKYIERRFFVANAHIRIGLSNEWYLASFQGLFEIVMEIIRPYMKTVEDYYRVERAVFKIFNLEQQLVVESYENNTMEKEHTIKVNVGNIVSQLHSQVSSSTNSLCNVVKLSENVTKGMDKSAYHMEQVSILSNEAKEMLRKEVKGAEEIFVAINSANKELKELIIFAKEAEKIAEIVNGIAEETNLLALNASIESARHGENGRAFSVIAERVRVLSNGTKDSVNNITQMISNIESKIITLHQELNKAEELAIKGKNSSDKANDFFDHILEMVRKNREESQSILAKIEQQTELLRNIDANVRGIYNLSDELNEVMIEAIG